MRRDKPHPHPPPLCERGGEYIKNRCRLWPVVANLPDTDPLPSVRTMQADVGEFSQVFK